MNRDQIKKRQRQRRAAARAKFDAERRANAPSRFIPIGPHTALWIVVAVAIFGGLMVHVAIAAATFGGMLGELLVQWLAELL